jgi:predicted CoA-binding protein
VPVAVEAEANSPEEAMSAAARIGFPVVLKLCGPAIAHKTERGLVRLGLDSPEAVASAAAELMALRTADEQDANLLVAGMVSGNRELICGCYRDPSFGPMVMLGVGGILTEAIDDVVMGVAPLTPSDAHAMVNRLHTQRLLAPTRGEPAVDRDALATVLVSLSNVAVDHPEIVEVDLNPVIIAAGRPVAVDALVVEDAGEALAPDLVPDPAATTAANGSATEVAARFSALFDPKGVVVAGASSHPGKFGFVTLHNLRAAGYEGALYATKLDGEPVLGEPTLTSLDQVPPGTCDLLVICTPPATVPELVADAAALGIRAVFMTTAGYGESGPEGKEAQQRLVSQCADLGLLLAGPNGQGGVSTPRSSHRIHRPERSPWPASPAISSPPFSTTRSARGWG